MLELGQYVRFPDEYADHRTKAIGFISKIYEGSIYKYEAIYLYHQSYDGAFLKATHSDWDIFKYRNMEPLFQPIELFELFTLFLRIKLND